jgi:hypothetical protein
MIGNETRDKKMNLEKNKETKKTILCNQSAVQKYKILNQIFHSSSSCLWNYYLKKEKVIS